MTNRQVWIGHSSTQDVLIDPGVGEGDRHSAFDWPDFTGRSRADGLWALPTDTAGQSARVRDIAAQTGNNIDQEMFIDISDLLREYSGPPEAACSPLQRGCRRFRQ